jgi:hypothetical protein
MKVRLTKKLAECIDGVALHGHEVGDLLDLQATEARLLVAEQWAIPERREKGRTPAQRDTDEPTPRRRHEDGLEGTL